MGEVAAGVFREFWQQGLLAYDGLVGIHWSWLALDGAMGKAPLGGGRNRPQPHRQREDGNQESLLTDSRGVPLGLVAGGANTNDFKLVQQTFDSIPVPRPLPADGRCQHLCVDAGYDYAPVHRWADKFDFTLHVRRIRQERKQSTRKKPRRWVVERSHSFLHRFRRLHEPGVCLCTSAGTYDCG